MRNFKVKAIFNSKRTEIVVTATSTNNALIIAKKMYPTGRMLTAVAI